MRKLFIILLFFSLITISKSYCSDYVSVKNIRSSEANLLKNGNFSDSLKNWLFIGQGVNSYHPADPGRADFKVENGEIEVKIKNKGISIYSIMIYQSVVLKKDSTYTTSFYAKSDSVTSLISNFTQDGTYTNFSGDREFKLTNVMTKYSYDFKMTKDLTVLFQFCLGNKGTGSIFLDSLVVTVRPSDQTGFGIQKQLKSDIHIFPNPARDRFVVETTGQFITKVELLNVAGQLVDTRIANTKQVIIERNNIPPGAYFCKAYTNSGCLVGKVLLQD